MLLFSRVAENLCIAHGWWLTFVSTKPVRGASMFSCACWQSGGFSSWTRRRRGARSATNKTSQDGGDGFGRREPQPQGYSAAAWGQLADTSLHQLWVWQEQVQLLCWGRPRVSFYLFISVSRVFCATCKGGGGGTGGFVVVWIFFQCKLWYPFLF